jgi:type III secretion protein D
MTRLRVLSGKHAGASINLDHQQYTVGANDEFDIYIGDWDAQDVRLDVGADGLVHARWRAEPDSSDQIAGSVMRDGVCELALEEFLPVRFGSIIICIGSSTQTWPSDADVLQKLYLPGPNPNAAIPGTSPPKAHNKLRRYAVFMTVVFMSVAGAITLGVSLPGSQAHAPLVKKPPLIERVKDAVIFAGASHLAIAQDGGRVTVDGLLDTREHVSRVNRKLEALGANTLIARRYRSLDDVADMIRESTASYPLQIKHAGGKSFEVQGQVADQSKVKAVLDGLQSDLAGYGVTIIANLKTVGKATEGISAVLINDQGISYTQGRDGVKHLMPGSTIGFRREAGEEPPASAAAQSAGSNAATRPVH